MNSFPLSNNDKKDVLFFDVFYKNNKIHLILPIYNQPYSPNDIKLRVNNDTHPLVLSKKFERNGYEPTLIYIYDYFAFSTEIKLTIEYKNITREYNVTHIICNEPLKKLGITTLFKDDYHVFPFFYEYYKKQGVSHFYMYYNGKITPEIREIFTKDKSDDVTLIEWDFRYWNFLDTEKEAAIKKGDYLYAHHAQLGQLHHAIYRYGKDVCEYMAFCDLDEYLYIPKYSLLDFIQTYPTMDLLGFRNKWANDDITLLENKQFPSKLITSEPFNYGIRSKNIYRLDSINTIYIHFCNDLTKSKYTIKSYIDFYMFHFYKWSDSNRLILEKCNIEEKIYLPC
jgi:hypothetical protein